MEATGRAAENGNSGNFQEEVSRGAAGTYLLAAAHLLGLEVVSRDDPHHHCHLHTGPAVICPVLVNWNSKLYLLYCAGLFWTQLTDGVTLADFRQTCFQQQRGSFLITIQILGVNEFYLNFQLLFQNTF